MASPENAKVGVCYIWLISLLLFIFTVSGAVFLVLYIIQPSSTTAAWYPIIGVSLVCFPWFFWSLTILYRIVSRAYGFRMICFGPSDPDHLDDNVPPGNAASTNDGAGTIPVPNVSDGAGVGGENDNDADDGENGDRNVNRTSGAGAQPGSPKRVHFGGVVVIGEDDYGADGNQGSPKPLSSPPSSSSSSSPSSTSNESEMPLRLHMAA